jgi:hypothetical protein
MAKSGGKKANLNVNDEELRGRLTNKVNTSLNTSI